MWFHAPTPLEEGITFLWREVRRQSSVEQLAAFLVQRLGPERRKSLGDAHYSNILLISARLQPKCLRRPTPSWCAKVQIQNSKTHETYDNKQLELKQFKQQAPHLVVPFRQVSALRPYSPIARILLFLFLVFFSSQPQRSPASQGLKLY